MKFDTWHDLKDALLLVIIVSCLPFLLLSLYFWFTFERFSYFGLIIGMVATFVYGTVLIGIIAFIDKRINKKGVVPTLED